MRASSSLLELHDYKPNSKVTILLFPYAGGSARSYANWNMYFGDEVSLLGVEYPGRGARRKDSCANSMSSLLCKLTDVNDYIVEKDAKVILFGYSMGAITAFEMARMLRRSESIAPEALIVSSRRSPCSPVKGRLMHSMDDCELIDRVLDLDGIPKSIAARPDSLRQFLPALRADLEVSDNYEYRDEEALACPIYAFAGSYDPLMPRADWEKWHLHTSKSFKSTIIEGGHFLKGESAQALAESVRDVAYSVI